MNFQLFKIAQDNVVRLPRIGALCSALKDIVAPSYADTEPEHPELEQLALLLSDKFSRMDSETFVFDGVASRDPFHNLNSDLSQFKLSELRGFASAIENPSVELNDSNIRALLSLVLQAAVFVAWQEFTIKNPIVLVIGAARGLSAHRMLKLASDEEDEKLQKGRKTIRIDRGALDPENPLTSQGLLENALISYNAAFNALVVSSGVKAFAKPARREGERSAGEVMRAHSLLQMVDNLDYLDAHSQYALQHKTAFDSGKRATLDGTVLLPDPIYGPVVGGNHLAWSHEGIQLGSKPRALLSSSSLGQSEEVLSKARSQDLNIRLAVFGRATRESDVYGTEHSAIGAHKRMAAAYRRDTNEIKTPAESYLLKGFLHHIYSLKVNGLDLSRWKLHIPGMSDEALQSELKKSLAAVVSGVPRDIKTMKEAAEICDRLVKEQEGKFSAYDSVLDAYAKKISNSFFGYVAQLYLHLPTHFYSEWTQFDFREALSPIPEIKTELSVTVAGVQSSLQDIVPLVLGGPPANSESPGELVFNRLQNIKNARSTPAKNNLLILARNAAAGKIPLDGFLVKTREFVNSIKAEAVKFAAEVSSSVKLLAGELEREITAAQENKKPLSQKGAFLQTRLTACGDLEKAIASSGPSAFADSVAVSVLLSICDNPNETSVIEAAKRLISAGETDSDKRILAAAISGSFPPGKFNIDSVEQVHTDYNNFAKFRKFDLDREDEFHVYDNPSAVVPEKGEEARFAAMYNCTQHYIVDQLKREHNARNYPQNKIELEKIIKAEYPLNPEDAGTSLREADIDEKISELKKGRGNNHVFARLGLGELLDPGAMVSSEYSFDLLRSGNKTAIAAAMRKISQPRMEFLKKLQDFFYKNTKSSVVSILRNTPRQTEKGGSFDESYYDALMVYVSRTCGFIFEDDIAYSLFHRYGEKEFSMKEGDGGKGTSDIASEDISPEGMVAGKEDDRGPLPSEGMSDGDDVGEEEQRKGQDDLFRDRKAKKDPGEVLEFTRSWLTKPVFRKDGKRALHPYSLPGFFAEILAKREILEDKSTPDAEKRQIAKFFSSAFSTPGNLKYYSGIPFFAVAKRRAADSLGNDIYVKSTAGLASLLSAAAAEGITDAPKSRADIVARLSERSKTGFTNPLTAMRRINRGEAISESYDLTFIRFQTSMGKTEKGSYAAWEKEALREIEIFASRTEFEINQQLVFSAQEKTYLIDLLKNTVMRSAADLYKEAYTPEDLKSLRALAQRLKMPTQKASTLDLYVVLDSGQFADMLRGPDFSSLLQSKDKAASTKERVEQAKLAIKRSRKYKYAFEYELNLGRTPAEALKNVLLQLRGPALGTDENGKPVAYNREYEKIAFPVSKRALEKAARSDVFKSFLQDWIKTNIPGADFEKTKDSLLDNKNLVTRFEQLLKEEFGDEYQADTKSAEEIRALSLLLSKAWEDVQSNAEQLGKLIDASSAAADVAEEASQETAAVDMQHFADAKSLASLISDACENNTENRIFVMGLLDKEVLERKILPSDAEYVKKLGSDIKAMPPTDSKLKALQEGVVDGLIARPAEILSERYRKMVEAGDTSRNARVGLRQQAGDIVKRQLAEAASILEMTADRLVASKAAEPMLKSVARVSNAASADGGAVSLISDGKVILNANIFYSNVHISTAKFYSVFADNLDRKIKEWVPKTRTAFPGLIQLGDIALGLSGKVLAGSSRDAIAKLPKEEIQKNTGSATLADWQVDLIAIYIESKGKEEKIAQIRDAIAKIPVGAASELQAWREATATKEEDLDKARPSAFPLTLSENADLVSEEQQRLTPDDDDDASITQSERKGREAALARVSVAVKDMRRALDLARGVPDKTRTQGKRLIDSLEAAMLADTEIVNVLDKEKLEEVSSAISSTTGLLRAKNISSSLFSDLLASINKTLGQGMEIDIGMAAAQAVATPAANKDVGTKELDAQLKQLSDFVKAGKEKAEAFGLSVEQKNTLSRVGQIVDLLSEGRRKIQPGANIAGAKDLLGNLYASLMRGTEIRPDQLGEMLDKIHRFGILTDEFRKDELEIVEEEMVEVPDEMADFDRQLDSISRLLPETAAYLSAESQAALGSAIAGLSSSNRTVAPDADIARATKELKVLENALRARYDLRPHQVETLVVGLRALGIEAREAEPAAPLAQPPAAQSGAIAPDEEGVMEIKEEDFSEIAPQAPISQEPAPAEAEQGPLEVSEEEVTEVPAAEPDQGPLEVSEEDVTEVPVPAPKAISEVTYEELRSIILRAVTSAKTAGAAGDAVSKLSHLVDRLSMAMPPPMADEVAFRAQMGVAIERAKTVLGLVAASVGAPTWTRGSELPHMPELDALMGDIDKLMSPQRRAARAVRFVKIGDSWMI